MKQKTLGTTYIPAHRSTREVNTLQERYFRTLTPDCDVRTPADAYYLGTIAALCLTFLFPPFLILAACCLYKAKKGGRK